MKRLLLIFCFALVCVTAFANKYKYRAYSCQYEVLENGVWDESDYMDNDQLILIDFDNNKVKVLGSPAITLDIYEYMDVDETDNGGMVTGMKAVDQDGDECILYLCMESDGGSLFRIDYANFKIYYFANLLTD